MSLELAGLDYSYRPDARMWLNQILMDLATDYDWPQNNVLNPDTAFSSGQTAYSLPTNFSTAGTCFLVQNGSLNPIRILETYEFDNLRSVSLTGDPGICYIDEANSNIVFESAPATPSGKSWRLRYNKLPADLSLDETDDSVIPWFMGQKYLELMLVAYSFEHRDDDRYQNKMQEAQQELIGCIRNVYNTDSNSRIQLNSSVFRSGRRGTRSWGLFGR